MRGLRTLESEMLDNMTFNQVVRRSNRRWLTKTWKQQHLSGFQVFFRIRVDSLIFFAKWQNQSFNFRHHDYVTLSFFLKGECYYGKKKDN